MSPQPTDTRDLHLLVREPDRLAAAWESSPLLSTGLPTAVELMSFHTMEGLLEDRGLRWPAVVLLKDGRLLNPKEYAAALEPRLGPASGLIDAHKVMQRYGEGATVLFKSLDLYWPPVRECCASLSDALGVDMHANVYVTPPHSRGATAHFDGHSVFMRQVEGRKQWNVHGRPQGWSASSSDSDACRQSEYVGAFDLTPDACLYLPRGYIHEGLTGDEASMHLTFSFEPVTWQSLVVSALDHLPDDSSLLRQDVRALVTLGGEAPQLPTGLVDEVVAILSSPSFQFYSAGKVRNRTASG